MADINPLDPNAAQLMDLSQQRKLADLLTQQGLQAPQGQMVSGQYVKSSPLQYFANMANLYAGQKTGEAATQKATDYANALRQQGGVEVQDILETYKTDPNAALRKAAVAISPEAKSLAAQLSKSVIVEPTTLEREFNAVKAQGYQGNINDFKNQMSKFQESQAADAKQRLGLEGSRFGLEQQKFGLEQQKFAQELGGGKLTESQGNATAFGMRAKESNALLNQLEQGGTKNTGVVRSTVASTFGMTPFIGEKLEQGVHGAMNVLPSALGGPNAAQQATDQARRNFVTAVLRKESGAAISPSEFANEAQKYFPQPGDTDSVIRQKQHARETAIKALEIQAGPGANFIKQMPTPKLDVGGAKKVVNFNDLP
jgi:hypothetical protein